MGEIHIMNFLVDHNSILGIEFRNWQAIVIILAAVSVAYVTLIDTEDGAESAAPWWGGLVDASIVQRSVPWMGVATRLWRKRNSSSYARAILVVFAISAISLPAFAVYWRVPRPMPTITFAHFVESEVDTVSCDPLGLRPDGKADGLIEFAYDLSSPLFFQPSARELTIRLDRHFPAGVYETGKIFSILAISDRPGGRALNEADGRYLDRNTRHLFAHFCRDGFETAQTIYELSVNGRPFSVRGSRVGGELIHN